MPARWRDGTMAIFMAIHLWAVKTMHTDDGPAKEVRTARPYLEQMPTTMLAGGRGRLYTNAVAGKANNAYGDVSNFQAQS
mmetsp:Transcript_13609/g.23174  ORF Transcript_13609/g.23174 Transcript_13609/m.23174 type:complete len:80 (+) Transcript_13609:261-500(+)